MYTQAQRERARTVVAELYLHGAKPTPIMRYLHEKEGLKFSIRQVKRFIQEVAREFTTSARYDRGQELGKAKARLEDLYFRAMAAKDFKQALAVQKEINEMLGLNDGTVSVDDWLIERAGRPGAMPAQEAAQLRREQVLRLSVSGLPPAAVAAQLRLPLAQVEEDLLEVRKRFEDEIQRSNPVHVAGARLELIKSVERDALLYLRNPHVAVNPEARMDAQDRLLKTYQAHNELLTQVGMLPKQPEQMRVLMVTKDYSRMTREELDQEEQYILAELEATKEKKQRLLERQPARSCLRDAAETPAEDGSQEVE